LQRTVGQVIHAHWTYEFAMGALSDSRPLIVTIHDAPLTIFRHMPDPYRAVRTVMAARVRIGAHHFSAVSPNLAARLRRQMFIRGPIPITPNVVPTRNADDVAVRRRRWKTAPVLVDIASASKLKNVRTLLNAFKTIRTKVPGVALRLVGEGLDANADLATWSRQQDSHHGVEFLGLQTQAEIGNLLSSADLFVHASRHESFGMSVIEALGHGVPVVAGNASGALPWILQSGRAGLLVDIDDPEVIAQAAVRVLGTPSIADRLSRNGLVRAQDFSEGSVVPSYLALYEKVQRLHTQSGQRPKRSSCRCE
jgi:L-malate glycosyltransferase